jgi:cell division protein FtsB
MVLLLMMFSLQGFRALVTQSVALTQVVTTDVALEQEAKLVRQKEKELERAMQHLKHPSYQERLARRVLGYVSPYEVSIQFAL